MKRQKSKRLTQVEDALKDANDLCRSAMQIALRDGKANWPAFRAQLEASLKRQHAIMYPVE